MEGGSLPMPFDLSQLFGMGPAVQKPDPRVSLALLLHHLAALLQASAEPGEAAPETPAEIPVRPRVEPLGG